MNRFPLCAVEKSLSFVIESQTIPCPIKAHDTRYIWNDGGGCSKTTSHLLSSRWVFTSADIHRKMLCSEWEVVLDTILQ